MNKVMEMSADEMVALIENLSGEWSYEQRIAEYARVQEQMRSVKALASSAQKRASKARAIAVARRQQYCFGIATALIAVASIMSVVLL